MIVGVVLTAVVVTKTAYKYPKGFQTTMDSQRCFCRSMSSIHTETCLEIPEQTLLPLIGFHLEYSSWGGSRIDGKGDGCYLVASQCVNKNCEIDIINKLLLCMYLGPLVLGGS